MDSLPSFFRDFLQEKAEVSARLAAFVDSLPPAVNKAALEYGRTRGLNRETMAWTSIYFYFPFWVQHELGHGIESDCLEVAYANSCLTYMVLIQDELMDECPRNCGSGLMAANAFMLEAHLSYARLFPCASSFWQYLTSLMQNSWDALLLEQEKCINPQLALSLWEDNVQAAKVNWLKVSAVAVALLNGNEDSIPNLLRYLDYWQIACQATDDFLDWRSDLRSGNYSRFLVLAGAGGLSERGEHFVEEFIGGREKIGTYFSGIHDHYMLALRECLSDEGYLHQYMEYLSTSLSIVRRLYDEFFILAREIGSV
jgi:hypothetical protein